MLWYCAGELLGDKFIKVSERKVEGGKGKLLINLSKVGIREWFQ